MSASKRETPTRSASPPPTSLLNTALLQSRKLTPLDFPRGNCPILGNPWRFRVSQISEASILSAVEAITLFVKDIKTSRAFYDNAFARPVVYEDEVSFVLQLKNLMMNFLQVEEAHELVEPQQASIATTQSSALLTIRVESADATCSVLRDLGVRLLNGPIDRPSGRRTAAFADPSGHVWEIAQVIGDEVPAE